MALRIRHQPPPTGRGPRTGELIAFGPDEQQQGALRYEAYEGRWIVDLDGSAPPEVLTALMDACVAEAERCDAWLVPGCDVARALLANPRWHGHEEATVPRSAAARTVAVPPALARFCARVAKEMRSQAARPASARDPERVAISTERGEAILGFSAEDAQITWRPTAPRGLPGWDRLAWWTFVATPEALQAIGDGAVASIDVEEVVLAPGEQRQVQDVAALLDGWVADEVLLLVGDPQGAARTRAVRDAARRHASWFTRAWPLASDADRRAAIAALVAALLDDDAVEDVCADDAELLRDLKARFWGRSA